jgi:hypothetical protein
MSEFDQQREAPQPSEPSPLTLPPARLRERTADDLEFDVADPRHDLPLDDSERLQEDAEPLRD